MHFIGNVLVEPDGDRARAETYLVAYHHLRASTTKPERDYLVGLRYVDDFERRAGEWRIAARICVFESRESIPWHREAGCRPRRPRSVSSTALTPC